MAHVHATCLLLLCSTGSLLAAPPDAKMMERVARRTQAASFSLLCERMADEHPKLPKAKTMIDRAMPRCFETPGLPDQLALAALTKKELKKRNKEEEVQQLRESLKAKGLLAPLKNRGLRKAFIYMERSGIFRRHRTEDAVVARFCAEMKRGAQAKACAANQKVLAGALEMYAMDENKAFPSGAIDVDPLKNMGYIKTMYPCPATGKIDYLHEGESRIRCPFHGTTDEAVAAGAIRGFDGAAVQRLWETNAVFRSFDAELKAVSPDGKGLIRRKD